MNSHARRLSRIEAQVNRPPSSLPRLVVPHIPADEWRRTVPLNQAALLARTASPSTDRTP